MITFEEAKLKLYETELAFALSLSPDLDQERFQVRWLENTTELMILNFQDILNEEAKE